MSTITSLPYIGQLIEGRYLVQEILGQGSFGVVYEVRDLDQSLTFAMKMLRPQAIRRGDVARRYEREILLMAGLDHPNVVRIHGRGLHLDSGCEQGLPFALMDRLEGQTLGDLLYERGCLDEAEALDILEQLTDGLKEVHRKGIVHRDLKPDNIFLCERADGGVEVKLLDFGIAKAVQGDWSQEATEELTMEGMTMGTPVYMAPEQINGQGEVTAALDIYALGCIAYLMLTGEPPFEGKNMLETALLHLSAPAPELPADYRDSVLASIIAKALCKEPQDRYTNAGDLGAELRRLRARASHSATEVIDLQTISAALAAAPVHEGSPRQSRPTRPAFLARFVGLSALFSGLGALALVF